LTMVSPLQIAIIGCGWAGDRHARACEALDVEVRWAVDIDEGRAVCLRSIKSAREARVATDYREALADPDLDAVSICLPHDLHAPVAVQAAEAGKHVLVEKPLAATLDGADRMIEAAERAHVVLMVAENVRFSPVFHKVREILTAGAIGVPALIQMSRQCYLRESFMTDRPWFLDERAAAGGIMMAGGVHDFETMRMLIGEVESVYSLRAQQRFLEMEGDDTSVALVRFQNGVVGTLVESFIMKDLTTASGPEIHTLRIDGELGSLSVDDDKTICLFSERDGCQLAGSLVQHKIHVPKQNSFVLLMEHFAQCVRMGEEPITSGRSQRRPLEAVLAAYESMASGKPVALSGE
jgi:predicted dehydrogenase